MSNSWGIEQQYVALFANSLKVVEGLHEVGLESLLLQPPLPVVRHRRRRAQLAQVLRGVLR